MADNTPAAEETQAVSAPEVVAQDAPKEEVEIPTFAKGLDKTAKEEVEPEVEPEVVAPVPEEEEATLKKRLSGAISEVEKRNEEARRFVELQADQVRENNDLIHKIAAADPKLAQKVIEKVWAHQGIRSYKQLLERSKLEELRETDPNAYETKSKLMEVESRLALAEEKERKNIRREFLAEKGILENEYDPNYRKLMDSLEVLNPSLLSEDYDKALRSAWSIASGDGQPIRKAVEAPTLTVGGGRKPAPLPPTRPQYSSQTTWLAEKLNKLNAPTRKSQDTGYKIEL